MKLVIFGLTISSSWGNSHATLWRGLCRALARQGHHVVFFERDVHYYSSHRDLRELPDGELCLYSDWEDVLPLARRHLQEAEVGIVTSYCPDGIAATRAVLASPVRVRTFYDLDTPVTLDALETGEAPTYIGPRGLADFDLVLSHTGGRALEELKSRLGAQRVAPLYGSVDPDAHYPVPREAQFRSDLSFLGTYAHDRLQTLESLLVEPARRLPQQRFLIGGAQYPAAFPWPNNIFFSPHVDPAKYPAFYSSSRLTLNVTRRPLREMGYCPSVRLFEAAACGTPILSDTWAGLNLFFEPGAEILVAHTSEDTMAALQLPSAALAGIADRARERTLDEHTAAHRVRDLEAALNGVFEPPSASANTAIGNVSKNISEA